METISLWGRACDQLRSVLNQDVFSRWIAVIQPVAMEDDTLVLRVDNDFHQMWIEENYLPLIVNALKLAGAPAELKLRFQVTPSDLAAAAPAERRPSAAPRSKRARGAVPKSQGLASLNPTFTFDEFVIGPSNSFAHAAALAVAQAPGRAYNPLFIYGQTGLGKTHLIQAVGHRVLDTPGKNVAYISSEALLNEYVTALQNRNIVDFRNKYRNVDVMLVDDIHFLAGKERLQEEFFHTFNALYDARKQIIMTSDRPASEIAGLERRLVSRFEWGLVTELECPDFETRLAILRYKQAHASNPLAEELQTFIAENVKSNVRSLEGAMVRAISYSALNKEPLTLDALRYLLRDLLDKERQEDVRFDDIQKVVADFFDLRVTDMSSKRRPRSVALPRQVAMYLCRRLTRSSLPEIAESFGKTHATVLHACRTIHNRMDVDDNLRQNIRSVVRKLGHDPVTLQI
ncbi:MAG: chromosomal replication initiator protein DnaA [Kiritimatiellae bacterium]|nr:chromosomal replication initiator protein DnaA [Kiritimatiellia bacterium]